MPMDLEMINQIGMAINLIEKGDKSEGAYLLEVVYLQIDKSWESFNDSESMELLGLLAYGLRLIFQTEREIKVLERLCSMAALDLDKLGIMATDRDILATGGDFFYLGLAYKRCGKMAEAQFALNRARKLHREINWEVDVENILSGEKIVGPYKKKSTIRDEKTKSLYKNDCIEELPEMLNNMTKLIKKYENIQKPWWKFWK